VFGRVWQDWCVAVGLTNLAFNIITSSGDRQQILDKSHALPLSTLVSAMALQQIGVASEISSVQLFWTALLLGALAVAIALAFGLSGRDSETKFSNCWTQATTRQTTRLAILNFRF